MRKAKRAQTPAEQLSRTMTYLLRHGAEKEKLPITSDGFVKISDLLKHPKVVNFSEPDIRLAIQNCPKQRFFLEEREDGPHVRANQGHTLNLKVEMTKITDSSQFPFVIHGTYFKAWNQIKNTGLSRMQRQHIHFSCKEPSDGSVISGMRSSCQVAIYINLAKAMADGFDFFVSSNFVILTPGDDHGFLPPLYFSKVTMISTGEDLV